MFRWNSSIRANSSSSLSEDSAPSSMTSECTRTTSDYLHPQSALTVPTIETLNAEIRTISADLASSIAREMSLEETVERLEDELSSIEGQHKRSSRRQRRSNNDTQEIPVSIHKQIIQQERTRRMEAEARVVEHEDCLKKSTANMNGTTKAFEEMKTLKRKLFDERSAKENLEDLLMGIKEELIAQQEERDRLHDLVVPRSRFEGKGSRDESIKDKAHPATRYGTDNSVNGDIALLEVVKDVEVQRDGLQNALRRLKEKCDVETKQFLNRIKNLEQKSLRDRERIAVLSPRSPRRAASFSPVTQASMSTGTSFGTRSVPKTPTMPIGFPSQPHTPTTSSPSSLYNISPSMDLHSLRIRTAR